MVVKDIVNVLEAWAPRALQESYDNSGLQVGNFQQYVSGVLLALDFSEALLEEALERNCNLIIAHHPLLFSGLKTITGKNSIERMVIKAIQNNLSLYAIHTNLDNINTGVNKALADRLQLSQTEILQPSENSLLKLVTYAPLADAPAVLEALFEAGAGTIGQYSECSFSHEGNGTFKPGWGTQPTIGTAGGARETVPECKLEVLIPAHLSTHIVRTLQLAHPYETVAYELYPIKNVHQDIGAGMIGYLPSPMTVPTFLPWIKENLKVSVIKYTETSKNIIEKVAVCGGSGSFLLPAAKAMGADAFITADFKYHQFFESEGDLLIADIGHYESEQFTPELLKHFLRQKLPNIALHLANTLTNPVKYFH